MTRSQTEIRYSGKEPGSLELVSRRIGVWTMLFLAFLWWSKARGAESPFHPLDLAPVYTTSFSNPPPEVTSIPSGSQIYGGVPFVIGGMLEVTGTDAARHGEFSPPEVRGISVQQNASRVHLLHGARHGLKDGIPLA